MKICKLSWEVSERKILIQFQLKFEFDLHILKAMSQFIRSIDGLAVLKFLFKTNV